MVGPFGLLQTIADAVKFLLKEVIIPSGANKVLFFIAPIVSVMLAFMAWAVIPFPTSRWVISDINVGILYLFAVSIAQPVYGVVMAGWASNSKYAFLSALRSTALNGVLQEVSISFVIITVLLFWPARSICPRSSRRNRVPAYFGLRALEFLFHPVSHAGDLLRLVYSGAPAPAFRSAGSGIRTGSGELFLWRYSSGPFLLFFLAESP